MKKKIIVFLAVMFIFVGCTNLTSTETEYTVWTDQSTYSYFQTNFGTTLNDGMYVRLEFTSSQWKQIASSITSEGRHYWTKSQIQDWFIGRGFGNSEANQESAWLTTIDHGFIASRTGNIVYYILK